MHVCFVNLNLVKDLFNIDISAFTYALRLSRYIILQKLNKLTQIKLKIFVNHFEEDKNLRKKFFLVERIVNYDIIIF